MKIKKWRRVTHEGTGISLEVGRLSYSQKPQLAVMVAEVMGPLMAVRGAGAGEKDGKAEDGKADDLTPAQMAQQAAALAGKSAALREAFSKMDPELIADVFEHKVRNVQELETEDGPVTTGKELLDVVDQTILMWVLTSLVSANQLSDQEGKASGSPSTSSSSATESSGSPAVSTAPADGATPSTAKETPTEGESSTQLA